VTDIRRLLNNKDTTKLEVLTSPVNALGLDMKRSLLQKPIERLRARLRRRGIRLRLHFYLGEDWGCVTGTANIEVGFYDAAPILKELNREIRGWSNDARTVDYLLRHETGHAFCYAHRLYRNREFRRVFGVTGKFFDTYPPTDRYKPHPWSRDYVNPNRDHYAQKHPDEDFAETFSVWLCLPANWKKTYRNRKGALAKLEFVTKVVGRYGSKPAQVPLDPGEVDAPVGAIKATVAEILGASLTKYRAKAGGYIDPYLKRIARRRLRPADAGMILLADLICAHRKALQEALGRNARVTPATALALVGKMETRSRALGLFIPLGLLDKALIDVVSLATTLAARYSLHGEILPRP
jgi:hypothetical protein